MTQATSTLKSGRNYNNQNTNTNQDHTMNTATTKPFSMRVTVWSQNGRVRHMLEIQAVDIFHATRIAKERVGNRRVLNIEGRSI